MGLGDERRAMGFSPPTTDVRGLKPAWIDVSARSLRCLRSGVEHAALQSTQHMQRQEDAMSPTMTAM